MAKDIPARDYTLVLCEKPDAARRVTEALAEAQVSPLRLKGVEVFEFSRLDQRYVVCSASGHLYAISDPFRKRSVYPVFDLEWFPANLVGRDLRRTKIRVEVIKKLCARAKTLVNACDFDVEGETIGSNVFRYTCGDKEKSVLRAKFSTLTKSDLVQAFSEANPRDGEGLARAGRARHFIDFLWGVNFSRILSQSISLGGYRYRTISIGRVQGPTLSFVAAREIETNTFVPTPHWTATGFFVKDDLRFEAPYAIVKIRRSVDAQRIQDECTGGEGIVSEVKTSVFREPPPLPFDTGGLQKEAFRVFGFSPSKTLLIAERLYLDALISYPRTNSQKIPVSIDYRRIIQNLGMIRDYADYSAQLLKTELRPREGEKVDSAHPSIYPTGEYAKRGLDVQERRVFDLVVRRFLANFADDAMKEKVSAAIDVKNHEFRLTGRRTINEGWIRYYRPYTGIDDSFIPRLKQNDVVKVVRVNVEEKFDAPPVRYNQASLLSKMEKEEIGTKATRAEIIATLIRREYVSGSSLRATDLGLSVIETMKRYSPEIISTGLTRQIEKHLERIEGGEEDERELIESVMETISLQLDSVRSNLTQIGVGINQSITATAFNQRVLGACPVCKTGKLKIVRSMKTHKRFVGCTNYPRDCTASAPLPQRGVLNATLKPCSRCGWPVVMVRFGRFPWRLCVNMGCPGKGKRKHALSGVQKKRGR